MLDGSLSACEWGSDPDAVEPGIFGPSNLPKLRRDDYVLNSNDSYWISHPDQPLEGFDRIIGDERTERSLRQRSGFVMAEERLAGADGRPGDKFTRQQLQDIVFDNRQYAGELWRDELATFCEATPVMTGSSGPVDVSEACPVLRAWDLHDDLDSEGAILFRRFASRALGAVPVAGTPGLYTTQFDFNDPVYTPNGLNIANPAVEQSFADAVSDLRNAGIPLDAPLRDWQYERRGSEKIPIHGGPGGVGVFNAIGATWNGSSGANAGYSNVPHGSSFVMVAQFTGDEDCPVDTRTILTYSQSTNPNSPYFGDQTRMFSNKEWVDEAHCEDEIAADPNLEVTEISEATGYPRPKSASPLRVPLVPAFRQCTAPDRTHGPPLAFGSCSLAGADVAQPHGRGARCERRRGELHRLREVPRRSSGAPGPPDDSDVKITVGLTDVRCAGAGAACGPANARGGSDYTGQLEVTRRPAPHRQVQRLEPQRRRDGPGDDDRHSLPGAGRLRSHGQHGDRWLLQPWRRPRRRSRPA